MTFTRMIGAGCNKILLLIVHGLALSRIHPNVLTFFGLLINIGAAVLLAAGQFRTAGAVIIAAGLFDMVDGRVARETNQVTRFGGFFDSVLDRYSDLALLIGPDQPWLSTEASEQNRATESSPGSGMEPSGTLAAKEIQDFV